MTTQLALPSAVSLRDASPPMAEVLQANRDTYHRLAPVYESTAAERLAQAQRWLFPLLKPMRQASWPLTVLELGPADGFLAGHICELGHDVTAVEFAESMAAATRRNAPEVRLIQEDFLTCGLAPGFDVVICSAFVHLFPYPWDRAVLERVRDLLAPFGQAYLATTLHSFHSSGFENKEEGLRRFRTRYTEDSFEGVIRAAGLTVTSFYKTKDRLAQGKIWGNWLVERSMS